MENPDLANANPALGEEVQQDQNLLTFDVFPCGNPGCQKICAFSFNPDSTITCTCQCSKTSAFKKTYDLEEFNNGTQEVNLLRCTNINHDKEIIMKYCPICQKNLCAKCLPGHDKILPKHEHLLKSALDFNYGLYCEERSCPNSKISYCKKCGIHYCQECIPKHSHKMNTPPLDLSKMFFSKEDIKEHKNGKEEIVNNINTFDIKLKNELCKSKDMLGIHTYNTDGNYEIVDLYYEEYRLLNLFIKLLAIFYNLFKRM